MKQSDLSRSTNYVNLLVGNLPMNESSLSVFSRGSKSKRRMYCLGSKFITSFCGQKQNNRETLLGIGPGLFLGYCLNLFDVQ